MLKIKNCYQILFNQIWLFHFKFQVIIKDEGNFQNSQSNIKISLEFIPGEDRYPTGFYENYWRIFPGVIYSTVRIGLSTRSKTTEVYLTGSGSVSVFETHISIKECIQAVIKSIQDLLNFYVRVMICFGSNITNEIFEFI